MNLLRSRKFGLFLSITGFIIAITTKIISNPNESLLPLNIASYIGIFLLLIGALINFFVSQPYTKTITKEDWILQKNGTSFFMIKYEKHKKTSPNVHVYKKNKNGYNNKMTMASVNVHENNNVVIIVNTNSHYNAKVVIK